MNVSVICLSGVFGVLFAVALGHSLSLSLALCSVKNAERRIHTASRLDFGAVIFLVWLVGWLWVPWVWLVDS